MQKRLLTADEVKQLLNISDFRHVSKELLINFASTIPYLDKEVAIKIIEQFPEFSTCATEMVTQLKEIANTIVTENGNNAANVMNGYKQTLSTLESLANSTNLSADDKRYFAEKMIEVANKMADYDTTNKEFLTNIYRYSIGVIGGLVTILAVALGVNVRSNRIGRT